MKIIKHWYENLSIYSAIGMAISFLIVGDFVELNTFFKIILLASTATSLMFIATRIFKFENFKGVK